MENCVIRNHTANGIEFEPSASSSLAVSNTLVADNGNAGIIVQPTGAGAVKAVFNRVEVYNNSGVGLFVGGTASTGTIKATAADSAVANNGNIGFWATSSAGQAATSLLVVRSVSANNSVGVSAFGGATATLRVGQSAITGNAQTWFTNAGSVLQSFGDNYIVGNGDGDPALPTIVHK
jgi:hypothetical protein